MGTWGMQQVHNSLAMLTIGLLGSEEQKAQLLPRMATLESVAAWALTEPSNGSDASALTTSAKKVPASSTPTLSLRDLQVLAKY